MRDPKFSESIRAKIGERIDTGEIEQELTAMRKRLRQLTGIKDKLGQQIDRLDFEDPHYDRKFQDLQERQNKVYDEIATAEAGIAELQTRLMNVQKQKLSADNVYQFLLYFDKLYSKFTDLEKKEFMSSFLERVEIYPEEQPSGQILRRIDFRFPVYYDGLEVDLLDRDNLDFMFVVCYLMFFIK